MLERLSLLHGRSAQVSFLKAHPELLNHETVIWLADSVRDRGKVDPTTGLPLAEMAMVIAAKIKNRSAMAHSLRAMGNALYVSGQNKAAVAYHERARQLFAKTGDRKQVARTLSASIQPLILSGHHEHALSNAKKARITFKLLKDDWRLARLDLNTGNIFHRQDRFAEALRWYQKAHRYFAKDIEKDPEATGVALHNIAMCKVSLNDFQGALSAHQQARQFAEKHGMRVLVAQSDYNIAALYSLRGEHRRAMQMLLSTLEVCKETNDQYHVGLCQLDLSEIYLQLNLVGPAEEMAMAASPVFEKLGMAYEAAKSLVNLALAMARQNKADAAVGILTKAKQSFVKEKNSAWPYLTDFYKAVILGGLGRNREAWARGAAANRYFRTAGIPDKLILTELLLAQLQLALGKPRAAERHCSRAIAVLDGVELPLLACKAQHLMGRIYVALAKNREAYNSYEAARRLLEAIRSDLHIEELSISFMLDKLEIFEGLVQLCLNPESEYYSVEEAFQYIEQSKSRSLQDLVSGMEADESAADRGSVYQDEVRNLRAEINSYSRRLIEEDLRGSQSSSKLRITLQQAIQKREKKLLRLARELPIRQSRYTTMLSSGLVTLQEVRASLPEDSILLEYFQIQDQLLAVVLTRETLNITPLTTIAEVGACVEHLEYQFEKFRLGPDYVNTFGDALHQTVQRHLMELHQRLLAPLENQLCGKHLIIVPHGILHRLPFQALFDGKQYLIDRFTISFAPSAAIYGLCANRQTNDQASALVMGVPDAAAPLILDEARSVAGILPGTQLLLNEEATTTALKEQGLHSRFIHLATHGYYRQDNPMFSGVRMGDSLLTLYDLYRFKLPVDLITLSGCATGANTVAGGDELLGLVRGLLFAGASSALLTLWDVQDRSTLEFMTHFYKFLVAGANKADAVQQAMQAVRNSFPHPYYWAPFTLVGNFLNCY